MNTLHILHSEAATGWGGQEIRVFQESCLLLERGHRVSIVCRPESPLWERCQTISKPGFNVFSVSMDRVLNPSAFLKLFRIIKLARPDILHTHSSVDSWLASIIGMFLNIPIVRSRHISIPVKKFFPNHLIYSKFPKRIITSGEAISEIIAGLPGIIREKVVSIPAGADMKRFDFRISGEAFRDELNLNPDQPLVGKIGVIRGWKGHDYFLEAIPEILEKFPEARFVIVGDGPGREEVQAKARAKGLGKEIFFLGHREDVPRIMAGLNGLVMASIAGEGTPQVIPQAFAMKIPVVATTIGSMPDLLEGGRSGILVEPRNGKSLAEGVVKLLRDPSWGVQLAENAYEVCRRNLTVDIMMDKTLEIYWDVLNANRT